MKKRLLTLFVLVLMLACVFAQGVFASEVAGDTTAEESVCDCPECHPSEVEAEMPPMEFKFDIESLGSSALIMGKGMLGIAIVTAIIIAIVMILNVATSGKKDK